MNKINLFVEVDPDKDFWYDKSIGFDEDNRLFRQYPSVVDALTDLKEIFTSIRSSIDYKETMKQDEEYMKELLWFEIKSINHSLADNPTEEFYDYLMDRGLEHEIILGNQSIDYKIERNPLYEQEVKIKALEKENQELRELLKEYEEKDCK